MHLSAMTVVFSVLLCLSCAFRSARGPPGPPGGVRVDEVTASSASVTWSHGTDNLSPISTYSIQYRDVSEQDWRDATTVPADAPIIFEARALSATKAVVSWMPVQNVQGYQVRYWREALENEAAVRWVPVQSRENHMRLDNMTADSHYLIEVRAYNGAGYGPASQRHKIHTKKAPPSQPPKIFTTKKHYCSSTINIGWEKVQALANESNVAGYKVLYRKEGQPSGTLYTTEKQSIDLPRMKEDYLVEVRAHSEGGDGAIAHMRIPGAGAAALASPSLGFFCVSV